MIPNAYSIAEAYPNPFNPETRLEFSIPEAANVTLTVYDIADREVAVLVEGLLPAGSHSVRFDGSTLASGVYFASFKANDFKAMRKMLLLKYSRRDELKREEGFNRSPLFLVSFRFGV